MTSPRLPFRSRCWSAGALLAAGALFSGAKAQQAVPRSTLSNFEQSFSAPPDNARPMMRWWWFGSAVENGELSRELHVMQKAGFGGVEIQPVYPLSVDDPARGIRNLPYLSPEFLRAVHFSDDTARSLGLRVDITLGSGWPYGGPGTTLALSAGKLKLVALASVGSSLPLPHPAAGDTLIAAFAASGTPQNWSPQDAAQLIVQPGAQDITLPSQAGGHGTVLLFYASHTRQQVKRPAVGAEGLVLDHYARAAIDEHLRDVADPLAKAFGTEPPYSVFSDSLEVYGADWTPDLPAEFLRRRGYDLVPHLPELYAGGTRAADSVRQDWGQTLSDLIRENYLEPVEGWAKAHNSLFRSQTYGIPAVTLADEAVANLPEGEGPQWRQFSFTRWATSASHLYRRNETSAETFTWLHSPVFRATPLDMKVEADRMFLSGVNQIIGHGWPYTPPGVPEPGWNLYAAAVFNDHNPWFPVMPDITQYLRRASWLLRQGEPANDVAILLPEEDAQASFSPGHVSVTDEMHKLIAPELMRAVLDAGYNVDYVDAATLNKLGKVPYPVLVLPSMTRLPLSTARLLASYAAHGGHIISTGTLPSMAPGLREQTDSAAVAATVRQMFTQGSDRHAAVQVDLADLPAALHAAVPPDMAASSKPDPAQSGNDVDSGLGFIHRRLSGMDVYFVANSSREPLSTLLDFRAKGDTVRVLSLDTGQVTSCFRRAGPVAVRLAPYESMVFLIRPEMPGKGAENKLATLPSGEVLVNGVPTRADASTAATAPELAAWTIEFPGSAPEPLHSFQAWNELSGRKFFSGQVIYRTTFRVSGDAPAVAGLSLDFGEGTPTVDTRRPGSPGIRALLNPPIREAAEVFLNGKRVGAVWHPPYRIDLSPFVQGGENRLEIRVDNTAVNELAGQPPRDYTALNAKYGKRFDPQDMDQIQSLPSGLMTAPRLVRGPAERQVR